MQFNSVKLCKSDLCIEAGGRNAELLVGAFVFVLICVGVAALAKS
ncbi:MAG: hypothetical protein SFU99_03780 [Saprospiraceae bacterium]|nr:hypothetical protein [Saprospiraceae bacterium]